MDAMGSQVTSLTIVYSTVYSGADQSKHQSSASLAFVRRIHRWPVNSPQRASNAENVSIWWRHHIPQVVQPKSYAQSFQRSIEIWVLSDQHCWASWRQYLTLSAAAPGRNKMEGPENVMTTFCHGNAFHIAGPLWGEYIGNRWFPSQRGRSNSDLWWFICVWPQKVAAQAIDLPVTRDVMTSMYWLRAVAREFIKIIKRRILAWLSWYNGFNPYVISNLFGHSSNFLAINWLMPQKLSGRHNGHTNRISLLWFAISNIQMDFWDPF